jgi:hypothetical protein
MSVMVCRPMLHHVVFMHYNMSACCVVPCCLMSLSCIIICLSCCVVSCCIMSFSLIIYISCHVVSCHVAYMSVMLCRVMCIYQSEVVERLSI